MQHSIKKIKVRGGVDANKALVKKMIFNLLTSPQVVTTEKKAKVLKSVIERLITKAKVTNEANKNVLLKYFPKKSIVDEIFKQVQTTFADRTSGYVRIVKLNQRANDGALMTQIEWVEPITFQFKTVASKQDKKVTKQS